MQLNLLDSSGSKSSLLYCSSSPPSSSSSQPPPPPSPPIDLSFISPPSLSSPPSSCALPSPCYPSAQQTIRHLIDDDTLEVTPLGAGCEVGRSCIVVSFRGSSVMLDCGLHPAYAGIGTLPLFDAVDMSSMCLCLCTHFHLDHCGAIPYVATKTNFTGKIVMTEPTKAICKLLWLDYTRMGRFNTASSSASGGARSSSGASSGDASSAEVSYDEGVLFDEFDVERTLQLCETIDFHEQHVHENVTYTCYGAGHVLGACMFMIEIGGVRLLYTGDYSREVDRHVPVAEIPKTSVHVLICEATYGVRVHDERLAREMRLFGYIRDIVIRRKGKCLLPVFALGRAQEILLMLDEFWETYKHEMADIPIVYVSPMATRSMRVLETFVSMCGDSVRERSLRGDNPFDFKYIKNARNLASVYQHLHQDGPCVIMAAPGMLQSGMSREIFELWAGDSRNGVILTGYAVKGTVADELKKEPDVITLPDRTIKRRCTFEQVSFSAHADFNQTQEFIRALQTPNVVLVHGERGEMHRLKQKLVEERPSLAVFAPEILQKVCLKFPTDRCVRAVGKLAKQLQNGDKEEQMNDGHKSTVEGVVVVRDQGMPLLVDASDVNEYAGLRPSVLEQKLRMTYCLPLQPLAGAIGDMYDEVETISSTQLSVGDRVTVTVERDELVLEWQTSPYADLIADSIAFLALEVTRRPTAGQALFALDSGTTATDKSTASSGGDVRSCTSDGPTSEVEDSIDQVLLRYLIDNFSPVHKHFIGESVSFEEEKGNEFCMDAVTTSCHGEDASSSTDGISGVGGIGGGIGASSDGSDVLSSACLDGQRRGRLVAMFEVREQKTKGTPIPVQVDFRERKVLCENEEVRVRILSNLRRLEGALLPIERF
eukprot:GHVS01037391.1.p1 GENE.GHVS01037391.1~~GHVS01037391.1.p1  ORF type:complete len:881 (+),score=167.62 GHVS01037391.1:1232-3874(+)